MTGILIVCTGNVCRSPIAEGALKRELRRRFADAAPDVCSAGIAGWEGSRATPEAIRVAAERDIDITDHLARKLRPEMIREADLILAMASDHRDGIITADRTAPGRTFTLKELVRLAERMPQAAEGSGASTLRLRISQADALRRSGFRGNPTDEDIPDPLGMPVETFRAVAWEIDDWCARLVTGLFGKAPARSQILE
jgi:protein-tyrosine phosphatase